MWMKILLSSNALWFLLQLLKSTPPHIVSLLPTGCQAAVSFWVNAVSCKLFYYCEQTCHGE